MNTYVTAPLPARVDEYHLLVSMSGLLHYTRDGFDLRFVVGDVQAQAGSPSIIRVA